MSTPLPYPQWLVKRMAELAKKDKLPALDIHRQFEFAYETESAEAHELGQRMERSMAEYQRSIRSISLRQQQQQQKQRHLLALQPQPKSVNQPRLVQSRPLRSRPVLSRLVQRSHRFIAVPPSTSMVRSTPSPSGRLASSTVEKPARRTSRRCTSMCSATHSSNPSSGTLTAGLSRK